MTSYNYYWPPGPSSGYALAAPCPMQQPVAVQSRLPEQRTTVMPPPVATLNQALPPGQGMFLKVINPTNKKDWQDYTLRGVSKETMDTPDKMWQTIVDQCGADVVPEEIGYFEQATKHARR